MSSTPRSRSSFSRAPREACFAGWHDAQPELGALGLLDPQPEHFLGAVEADAERDVDLQAVEFAQMALDLARAHATGGHRRPKVGQGPDDLLVEAGEAALVLRDPLRVEARQPVARHLQSERAGAGQHRFGAVAVAAIARAGIARQVMR
jgi:hypothetical protein